MDVAACVCVGARVKGGRRREGISFFLRNSFHSLKSRLGRHKQRFCSRCSRFVREEDAGEGGGRKGEEKKKKKTEAKQHFLFERKQEKAGGARFWSLLWWNNKNLTLAGNGSASKRAWQILLKGSSGDPGGGHEQEGSCAPTNNSGKVQILSTFQHRFQVVLCSWARSKARTWTANLYDNRSFALRRGIIPAEITGERSRNVCMHVWLHQCVTERNIKRLHSHQSVIGRWTPLFRYYWFGLMKVESAAETRRSEIWVEMCLVPRARGRICIPPPSIIYKDGLACSKCHIYSIDRGYRGNLQHHCTV